MFCQGPQGALQRHYVYGNFLQINVLLTTHLSVSVGKNKYMLHIERERLHSFFTVKDVTDLLKGNNCHTRLRILAVFLSVTVLQRRPWQQRQPWQQCLPVFSPPSR